MKYLIPILLVFSSVKLAASGNYPGSNNIDVHEYSFSICLSDSCDIIRGESVINILHMGKGSEINLDLVDMDKNQKGEWVLYILWHKLGDCLNLYSFVL